MWARRGKIWRARDAATRAAGRIQLADAHVSLGFVRALADFDPAGAEWHYRTALRLAPDSVAAHYGYGCLLMHSGRFDEARVHLERARRLDPVAPFLGVAVGKLDYYNRRYQHAIDTLQEVLDREPAYSQAHYYVAMSLGQLGRTHEALQHLSQAKLSDSLLATDEAWLRLRTGDDQPIRQLLAQRRDLVAKGAAPPVTVLLSAIDAGDHDLAMWALREMMKTHSVELLQLNVSPRFDPLRGDPRFQTIAREVWRR